jgi:hypothetical protein
MYLVGAEHPHKTDVQLQLERAVADRVRLVTDAETLQEIVHRYTAIKRHEMIRAALEAMLTFIDEVYPIEERDVMRASEIALSERRLSARDALHIAVMERYRVKRILSFDTDFDGWPGIQRLGAI